MDEYIKYIELKVNCNYCENQYNHTFPYTGEDVHSSVCPACKNTNYVTLPQKPIHLVLSEFDGYLWIKPNRAIPLDKARGILCQCLAILNKSNHTILTPDNSPLMAFLTVDEEGSIKKIQELEKLETDEE